MKFLNGLIYVWTAVTHSTPPYFYPDNYLAKRCVKCKDFFPQLEEQCYCLSVLLMLSLIRIHLLLALLSSQIFKLKLSLKCLRNCKSENGSRSGIWAALVCEVFLRYVISKYIVKIFNVDMAFWVSSYCLKFYMCTCRNNM